MLSYIEIGNGLYQFIYANGEDILSAEFSRASCELVDKWERLLWTGREILPKGVNVKAELDLFLFYLTSHHEDFEDGHRDTQIPTEEELIAYWDAWGFYGFEYPLFD